MTKLDQIRLVREAKHTMAVYLSILGVSGYAASGFFIKWPDVMDSMLNNDDKLFLQDMLILVCNPMKTVAEGLVAHTESVTAIQLILEAMEVVKVNLSVDKIIICKAKLIAICNQEILTLRRGNSTMEPIRGLDDD